MTLITKNDLKEAIIDKLGAHFGKTPQNATHAEVFGACALILREMSSRILVDRATQDDRELHYLSMEFLMGRSLEKNAFNLGLLERLTAVLSELGYEPSQIFESEPDAGLGNGGVEQDTVIAQFMRVAKRLFHR